MLNPHRRPLRPASLLLLGALLPLTGSCSSAPEEPEGTPFVLPPDPKPDAIGFLLTKLDNDLKAWTNLKHLGDSNSDMRKLRSLERQIAQESRKRQDDLIAELESPSPKNRAVAAVALGFTEDEEVVGPLMAALSDPDELVSHNALIGLGYLASPTTPLGQICFILDNHPEGFTRVNAAYAISAVVGAGGGHEDVEPTCIDALDDEEGGVRVHAAIALARSGSIAAIPALGDMLYDDESLVARAAATSLVAIAMKEKTEMGKVARLVVDAATRRKPLRKAFLHELRRIASKDWGDTMEYWTEWAYRLP